MRGLRIPQVLEAFDRQTIKRLYRDLADHGRVRGEGGLAITSVHRVHATLHAALEEAVDDRLIATNSADGAHRLPDRARPTSKPGTPRSSPRC